VLLRRRTNVQPSAQEEMQRIVAALEALVSDRRESTAVARHSGRLLGDLLLARGYLVASELEFALARQAATGGRLGEIVVMLGFASEDVVVELLAEQYRIEVLDMMRVSLDPEVARLLPEPRAARLAAVPIRRTDRGIAVAIADPAFPNLAKELTMLLQGPIVMYLTTPRVITRLLNQAFAPGADPRPASLSTARQPPPHAARVRHRDAP
jgi:hypothetical protein